MAPALPGRWRIALAIYVAVDWLQGADAFLLGPAAVLKTGASKSVQVAQLGDDEAVACYFGVGAQHSHTCKVLTAADRDITFDRSATGATETGPSWQALAGLDSDRVVACYGFEFTLGKCRILTRSPSSLSLGSAVDVSSGRVEYLAVASLGSTKALVCFYDVAQSDGICRIVTSTGASVTAGSSLVVNSGGTAYLAAEGMSSNEAVVCFQDAGGLGHGKCCAIADHGILLGKGTDFIVNGGTTYSLALAKLDTGIVAVCYQSTSAGTCKALVLSGTSLSAGVDLFVDNTAQHVTLRAMYRLHLDGAASSATAAVCYRKDLTSFGTCNEVTATGLSLSKGAAITVSAVDTTDPFVARLGTTKAVMCYVDADDADSSKCKVLDFTITTTTTATGTSSVTSTGTTSTATATTTTATATTETTTDTPSPIDVPTVDVENVTFADEDLRPGLWGGFLSWLPPDDVSNVEAFAVYLAPGPTNWISTRMQLGLDLPLNTTDLTIPLGTVLSDFPYVLVYTVNSHGRQVTPVSFFVHDIIRPTVQVASLTFFDNDIDRGEIEGTLTWSPPSGGVDYVTFYRVFISEGPSQLEGELYAKVPVGANSLAIGDGAGGPLLFENFTHFGVFAANADEEAEVGEWLSFEDRAVPVAGAKGLSFVDLNLEASFIEGTLSWQDPGDVSGIDVYRIYFAEDVALAGVAVQIGGDLPVGSANSVPIGPAQAVGSFAYFVIIAVNAIGPQRVNSALPIADRGIDFTDFDLRRGYLAGAIGWWNGVGTAPARLRVYLADSPKATASRLEVSPGMQTVAFTGQHQFNQLLGLASTVGDEIRLSADLTRPTPASPHTVFAATGSRVLLRGSYSGQPLASLSLPFTLVFGDDFDPTAVSFELPAVQPGLFKYLHVSAETSSGSSLGLRVGSFADKAAPEAPVRDVTFSDQDFEQTKIGGIIRWKHPASPEFELRTSGSCFQPVADLDRCTAAAKALGLGMGGAADDGQDGVPHDPPFCYVEGAAVKFNAAGNNTGLCTLGQKCLCDVSDPDAPPTTRYAVWLSDTEELQEDGNSTLHLEVPSDEAEAVLQLGTRPWRWGVVLVGNDDGFNRALPATVRLKDMALFGAARARAEAAVCRALQQ